MGSILIGTSGYSYDDWVGPVYPPGTPRGRFLGLYTRLFSFTELNFTYYRQPSADALRGIANRTPSGFRFTVKAHRSLTHDRGPTWSHEAERFAEAVYATADRLEGVLLQFPFSFHYTDENRRYLASVTEALRPHRLFVEFRNAEWSHRSVVTEMERREIGLVVADLPRLDGLPRAEPLLTSAHGYLRFHGRNTDTWWTGTNVTRYDYSYSSEELAEWVGPVRALADRAETLVVAFNNHFEGQAVRNATEFARMLQGESP